MITGHLTWVAVKKRFDCIQTRCSRVCLVKKGMVEDCLVHMEEEGGGMEEGEDAVECTKKSEAWSINQTKLITFVDWDKIAIFG